MDSRREFLKKAMLLAAGGQASGVFPSAIQQALAIDPAPGSTFLDAEHVVILMQENRSFDHLYGSLRGVRGFNDPRARTLPDGNPVWLQTSAAGETCAPFRLNIKDTKATWMSCLPHSWTDQTAARNDGKHDRWLDTKASGTPEYAQMPLTLGFYNREDLPFYYALADAFTVCDQNFCSSLTGTTPNRLHLWTGTIRAEQNTASPALVRNSDVEYNTEVSWRTFPELLEKNGILWRIYQNELTVPTGLSGEAESWLSNFGDSPLEWFTQFHVRHHAAHRQWLRDQEKAQAAELEELRLQQPPDGKALDRAAQKLERTRGENAKWTEENFAGLPAHEQALHRRAFTVNSSDPHYRELETLPLNDGGTQREMQAPKGDVFHRFRRDVQTGKLPAVSWLVAPQKFSDHPDSPWYGAWYIAEALQILTDNAEVWRKTIFILCYDENDGYFDHVPPFVPPHPERPETGKVSAGIDTALEHVSLAQEQAWQKNHPRSGITEGPIGLGYRVPLVIASPWSRGGFVCSQVFDHTSILQLLEKVLTHKTGKEIRETNISSWRRAVCGDLTSAFRPWDAEKTDLPPPVDRTEFLSVIHQAQFREVPGNFHRLNTVEIRQARENPAASPLLPRQEPGVRPSCALPYELAVHGALSADRRSFEIRFAAGNKVFGARAAGAPFQVYAPGKFRAAGGRSGADLEAGRVWDYAVSAGSEVSDQWRLEDFADGLCHLQVHGPNGFFREFRCHSGEPVPEIVMKANGEYRLINQNSREITLSVENVSYNVITSRPVVMKPGIAALGSVAEQAARAAGWYDVRITSPEAPHFLQRFAGRLETGQPGTSDPAMNRAQGGRSDLFPPARKFNK